MQRNDPLEWLARLSRPEGLRGLEFAARSAAESGRLELGKVGDQLLAAFFRTSTPAWPLAGAAYVDGIRREVEARIAALRAMGALDDPAGFHPAPEAANVRVTRRTRGIPGFTPEGVEELTFWSEYVGAHEVPGGERWGRYRSNRRAAAWMLAHRELDRPWLICLHGYGMGWPAVDPAVFRAGTHHRDLGINVAGLVLPLHGERAGRSRGARELIQTSPVDMLHAQAQAVWDARRLIGWLRSLGAPKIAVHGFSLGGVTASLLANLEPELAGVIAGAPAHDITESYRSAASERPGGPVPDRHDPIWDDVRTMFHAVTPLSWAPALDRTRLALYAGRVDQLVSAESVAALQGHWRNPKTHWYSGGHTSLPIDSGVQAFVDERIAAQLLD